MKNFYKIQMLSVFVLLFSILRLQAQDNPQSFTAQAISASQIDLSFQLNSSSDPIVIAYNTSSSFGTPSGSYSAGDPISGGGTVIYVGSGTSFSHTTLFANTTYYYKAWSYNPTYSAGIVDDETTKKAEPTYHPTGFAVSTKTSSSITLEWVDAIGISKPDAYLIKGSTDGFSSISSPVDGTEEGESALVKIANYGDESVTFNSLNGNTTYYFKIFAYTNSSSFINYKTMGTIPSASETTDPTPAVISLSGSVTEGSEDAAVITVSLTNDVFLDPLTPANWTINNLPSGVSVENISRIDNTTVEITLQGNRTKDYDNDITNLEVIVAGAELSLNTSSASASSGFTFTATNDAESLTLGFDGTITEGSENGEVITINLTGGTFSSSINPANWYVSNLPTGVSASNFVRNTSTQVQFTLSGPATADYDEDITNMTVTCFAAEVDDHSGSNLSANTGVTFTATDDPETLLISYNSGSSIPEGSEHAKTIVATLSGGTFSITIDKSNWTLSPLPQGVTIGSIYQYSSTEVEITLSGNRSKDYDSDISSTLTILNSEFSDPGVAANLSSSNTVVFDADDDTETLTMTDDGNIIEGAENGEIISVHLTGGTFADPLTPANWIFSNLPEGVTIGSVDRVNAATVEITLNGNRTKDYDANITSATLTINQDEIDDYSSGNYVINTGITFTANDDAESIGLSWAATPGTNGAEASLDDEIITLTLNGGTFVFGEINTSNITAEGTATAVGISIESVTYISSTQVAIALAWNQTDFDTDKSLTIKVAGVTYDLGTSELSNEITVSATVEPAEINLSCNTINEASESSGEIYITLTNDNFKITGANEPNNSANWIVSNLPEGVTKGDITVTSVTTAQISLVGNRINDYDANITNVTVEIAAVEFVSENNLATANTGVVLIASDDAESLTLSSSGSITEGAENGQIISLTLSGGTWASSLTPANFTLNNGPAGVTVGTVEIDGSDATKVNITLSGNRTVDYDSDITGMTVTVASSELNDISAPLSTTSGTVTFLASAESVSIFHAGLTESNLDGANISITLTNETFDDGTLLTSAFSLVNAPTGLTVNSITWNTATTANLQLAYTGTDFDDNITDFHIVISNSELTGVGDITSNNLTITAVDDAESISLSAGTITESVEDAKTITVTLSGGTFVNPLNPTSWHLLNGPDGVSIGNVTRGDNTHATITLSGNRTKDYDVSLNVGVEIEASQINFTSSDITSDNTVSFTAASETDPETLTLITKTITEGSENGQVVTVQVNHGTFATSLTPSNWTISNLPTGVTAGSPVRISPTQATITLSGNRTIDYDADIYLEVTVTDAEVDDYSGADLTVSSGVTFDATDDAESIELTWAATPGTNGAEATMDNEIVLATLTGGTFIQSEILLSNIVASGTAVSEAGLSLESVSYVSPTQVSIALAWNNTDYDADKTLSIEFAVSTYSDGSTSISDDILLTATDEPASIKIYNNTVISEGSENASYIRVALFDDSWVGSLNPSNWQVNNLPTGVSMGTLNRVDDTVVTIALSGNRTVDYDYDITNIEVVVQGAEFFTHSNSASDNHGFVLTAVNDNEVINLSGSANEGNENNQTVVLTLSGGTWASSLNASNFTLNNAPTGVAVGSVASDVSDPTKVNLTLNGNRTVDYDANILNMTVTVLASELDDVSSGSVVSETGFTFTAADETATISHAGLTELNLNNAVVSFSLTDDAFIDFSSLTTSDFTLNNAPLGVGILSVAGLSSTAANITLSYDGTDFDLDYTHFSITVLGAEVASNGSITSNELTISHDDTESDEAIVLSWGNPPATNGAEATLDDEVILVTLSNGDFIEAQINTTNITLSGSGVTDAGVSIESVSFVNSTSIHVLLAWDQTDFDVAKTLTVSVDGAAYTDGSGSLTDDIELTPNVESITVSTTALTHFGNVEVGSYSTEQSFTVEGTGLVGDVILTPPADFEISTTTGGGFVATNPITLSPSSGSLNSTTIYVRFAPSSTGSKSGNISVVTDGEATKYVAVSGYGINSGSTAEVVITEVADYYGNSGNDYVEILNQGNASVDLDGWVLTQRYTGDNSSEYQITLSSGNQRNTGGSDYMILEPGEFAVIVKTDYNTLITNHVIDANVAVFSSGNMPVLDGNDRFLLTSPSKATEDYFGDWDNYSTFSAESGSAYERNSGGVDGELESSWSTSSNQSYEYTPGSGNINPLPIELLSFTANVRNEEIEIEWVSSSEINTHYFSVEESFDGLYFNTLGIVEAAGFSNTLKFYDFVTELPSQPMVYYRLTTHDWDGSIQNSPIILLTLRNNVEFGQPYVNNHNIIVPVSESISEGLTAELFDSQGRIIGRYRTISNGTTLIISQNKELETGLYFLRFFYQDNVINKKFLINGL